MLEIVNEFNAEMRALWQIDALGPSERNSDVLVGDRLRDFMVSINELPEYRNSDLAVPMDLLEPYFAGPDFRDAPNAVWLTYFRNLKMAKKPREDSIPFVPEGRIYHAWHRLTRDCGVSQRENSEHGPSDVKVKLGCWWELTFMEVVWDRKLIQPREPFDTMFEKFSGALPGAARNSTSSFAGVFHAFGLFDFLALRAPYEAKRYFDDWPPADDDQFAYHPRRHIMNEIVEVQCEDFRYQSRLAAELARAPLFAVCQIKAEHGKDSLALLVDILREGCAAGRVVGVLQSLGWEDFVIVWRLDRLEVLREIAECLSGANIRKRLVRSITQVILSGAPCGDNPIGEPIELLTQVRAHPGADLDDIRSMLTKSSLRPALGRYDVHAITRVSSESELRSLLSTLQDLVAAGLVMETESSFLVGRPNSQGGPTWA